MSAIALVLAAMGHTVSGSDLKDSPVAERLRSHGITVAVGHRADNVGAVDAVTYSPAVALTNPEIVARRAPGRAGGAPFGHAGRHLCHPSLPGRGRDPRQDHHGLDAVADPGRGRPASLLRHRGRRQRGRHQRGVGPGRVVRGRGGRELRHLPGHRARPGRADQCRSRPPRPLRHVRCAAPGLRRLRGRRQPTGAVVCADDPHAAAIGTEPRRRQRRHGRGRHLRHDRGDPEPQRRLLHPGRPRRAAR